jgi:predicted RNase H-like HicB family nuclease
MWDFLCVFRHERGGGYRITSAEMPALLAFGYTLADARETARDELMICLQAQTCEIDDPFRELRAEWRPNGGR